MRCLAPGFPQKLSVPASAACNAAVKSVSADPQSEDDQTRPRYPASTARPSRPTCAGRMRDATEHEQLGLPDLAGRAVSQWSDDRSVPARLSPAPAGQLLWTCVGVHPSSAMAPRKSAQRPPALHLFATHTDGRESRGGGGRFVTFPPPGRPAPGRRRRKAAAAPPVPGRTGRPGPTHGPDRHRTDQGAGQPGGLAAAVGGPAPCPGRLAQDSPRDAGRMAAALFVRVQGQAPGVGGRTRPILLKAYRGWLPC